MKNLVLNRMAIVFLIILTVVGPTAANVKAGIEPPLSDYTSSRRGQPIFLQYDPNPPTTLRVPPPRVFSLLSVKSSTIQINYLSAGQTVGSYTCYEWSNEAKTAFNYAASIWESLLNSTVPIEIDACWTEMSGSTLGGSSSNYVYNTGTSTWYQESLANSIAGSNTDPGDADMTILYNRLFDWYYGTDGNTPAGKMDFASVVLHEICHGLGFAGSMTKDGSIGYWGWGSYPDPAIYDRFAENGSGTPLLNLGNGTTALGSALTGGDIYFDGTNANAANGGSPPELYAPASWAPGSSYSHLDYDTFNETDNELMVWAISDGESIHNPGPITLGMFEDMGWTTEDVTPAPTVTSIAPSTGENNGSVSVTITGSDFQTTGTTSVRLSKTGESDINGTSVSVNSETQITCDFDLTGAATGTWNVVVTNPDEQSGELTDGFTVTYPAPSVTSITPDNGDDNDDAVSVIIAGSNFRFGTTAKLSRTGETDVNGSNVSVMSATEMMCDFDLRGVSAGTWHVVVTNDDAQSGQLDDGFTVHHITAPDLSIQKQVIGEDHQPGDPVTFTLTIANNGDKVASGVVVTDDLPSEVVSPTVASSLDITATGAFSYVWAVEPLTVSESGVITISAWIDDGLSENFNFQNTASVSDPEDTVTSNNSSSVSVGQSTIYLPLVMRGHPPIMTETFYPSGDATVLQGLSDTNFGATTDMWAGYDHLGCHDEPWAGEVARSFIQFDLSSIPAGASVTEATLYLYLVNSCDIGSRSHTVSTYRTSSSWASSSVNWNNQPGWAEAYGSKAIVSNDWGYHSLDVTNLVKGWVNGSFTNYGITVRGPESAGDTSARLGFGTMEVSGTTYDPYLEVTYVGASTSASSTSLSIQKMSDYEGERLTIEETIGLSKTSHLGNGRWSHFEANHLETK